MTSLARDLILNYVSLAMVAISGLGINLVLALLHAPDVLGVFNQALAVLIVAAQLGTGGIQYSVLRAIAADNDHRRRPAILWSALVVTGAGGLLAGGLVLISATAIATLLDSPAIERALLPVALSIPLLAINKSLLAAMNGALRMGVFAAGQATRALGALGFIVIATFAGARGVDMTWCFVVSEVLVAALLTPFILADLRGSIAGFAQRLREHVAFSVRGYFTGLLAEVNTRVDVIMLGTLLSDAQVGVYSFAAMFAEGFYQLMVVVRNRVNPILVRATGKEIQAMVRRSCAYLYPAAGVVGIAVWTFVWLLVNYVPALDVYAPGLPVVAVLLALMCVIAGLSPFEWILNQKGQPGYQSLLLMAIVITNIALNVALIPMLGINGAALATGTALVLGVLYLLAIVPARLQFRLV